MFGLRFCGFFSRVSRRDFEISLWKTDIYVVPGNLQFSNGNTADSSDSRVVPNRVGGLKSVYPAKAGHGCSFVLSDAQVRLNACALYRPKA